MSKLKLQLQVILPSLAAEANREQDREIKQRYYLLKAVSSSKKTVVKACSERGVSTDYFYKWARRLVRFGELTALKPVSRRPKRSPSRTPRRVEKRIVQMRKVEPYLGADRLSYELKRLFNMVCAASTVNAVLHRFNLISKKAQKRLTKKHIKRYRRPLPGYAQIDIKYVPQKINGEQYYEYNFVDHCTTWRFIRVYPSLDHFCVRDYLEELYLNCPFPIIQIQTDNGSEFTDKYRNGRLEPSGNHILDQWCKKHGIEHRLIPVGQKELNGKVENTHKQDDREHFSQHNFTSLYQIQQITRSYNERWNTLRRTKALGRQTPMEALKGACIRILAWTYLITEKYKIKSNPIVTWDKNFLASVAAPTPPLPGKPRSEKTGAKRMTVVNRYLQYDEWNRKKSSG